MYQNQDESETNSFGKRKSGNQSTIQYGTNFVDIADSESITKKIPYPKSVFFIIINEGCERFAYYGMKAVLTIYLVNVLLYGEDTATKIYHIFSGFCYFTPLLGAWLADSFLGRFRTIFYLSIVYALGNVILSLAATTPLALPQIPFSMLGLALIALGTGGIKPCVSAFGGDQFILPQQEAQLSTFFSIFYFSINAGSLISTFITPIFRKDISCFDSDTCYPLAFGVPAALMITALAVFVLGRPLYRIQKPSGNLVLRVIKCIWHAIGRKKTVAATGDIREHFLDYADDVYDKKLIEDVKILIRILVLYIPLPFFWALFDQQGSRWTLQATRMNGKIFGWLIKPDQMQVVNPFLILTLIPIFDQILYPALKKVGLLTKPLQKLTLGGILAGVAFIISGVLEINLEPTYAIKLVGTESQVHFVNTLHCNVDLEIGGLGSPRSIDTFQSTILSKIDAGSYQGRIIADVTNGHCASLESRTSFTFEPEAKKAFTYLIESVNGSIVVRRDSQEDQLEKSKEGNPKLKMIISGLENEAKLGAVLRLISENGIPVKELNLSNESSTIFEIEARTYDLRLVIPADEVLNRVTAEVNVSGSIDPQLGGNYIFTLMKNSENGQISAKEYTITAPNSIHMLWLLPQYIVITIAEVMFSVTGLEFSFAQAPGSMKSVIQAAWLLTVAFGNLIVVFITEFIKFDSQSKEFFLFAGLMFVDMLIFAVLAYFYQPAKLSDDRDENRGESPNAMRMQDNDGFQKD